MTDGAAPLSRRGIATLLRRCAIDHDWQSPVEELDRILQGRDASRLVAVAEYQRLIPAAFLSLHGLPSLDPDVDDALSRRYVSSAVRATHAAHGLHVVADILDRAGISWLTFKGPATAGLYQRPDLRVYHDIDIIVPPQSFQEAVTAMEGAGCELLDANWALINQQMRGQLHVRLPGGTVCDLHWHLLNYPDQRQFFGIGTSELFADRSERSVLGRVVPTLAPTATLIHLCLHAALSGGDRLGWLVDVDRAVRTLRPSWPEVTGLARRWRARLATAVILDRARRMLDTPVPTEVLGDLAPPVALRGLAAADRAASYGSTSHPYSAVSLSTPLLRDRGFGMSPRLRRLMNPRHAVTLGAQISRRSWSPLASGSRSELFLSPGGSAQDRGAYFERVRRQS